MNPIEVKHEVVVLFWSIPEEIKIFHGEVDTGVFKRLLEANGSYVNQVDPPDWLCGFLFTESGDNRLSEMGLKQVNPGQQLNGGELIQTGIFL